MPRKRATHTHSHETHHTSHEHKEEHHQRERDIQHKLVENLIALQKVHTDLAEKFDKLSKEISSLLTLFETAARSFAEAPSVIATEKDKQFLEKIDKLLEQNKTIAKGLVLMEDKVKDRMYPSRPSNAAPFAPPAAMIPQAQNTPEEKKDDNDEMQPSIVNRPLPRF